MAKAGFYPAEICLPREEDMGKWPVLACDQFTSQPEYWQKAEKEACTGPSTLHMILPEVYLEEEGVEGRIEKIHETMRRYADEVLTRRETGFVYVERQYADGTLRQGLVGCVDLEDYSYEKGDERGIRPSENTVVERIPPRLAVRDGAVLETPHILMLIDDVGESVIEPLAEKKEGLKKLYDQPLMLGGGHVAGWLVDEAGELERIAAALEALGDEADFRARYGAGEDVPTFLMAVGDGNHSLATAKAYWEKVKPGLDEAEQASHPARYCLVELENIQSPAIQIEPIHRVVFGADTGALLHRATVFAAQSGARLARAEEEGHRLEVLVDGKRHTICIEGSGHPLAVGAVEAFLEEFAAGRPSVKIDYIHGEDAVGELAVAGAVGILLPPFEKSDLFRGVAMGGVLPKKTFSMGHAEEKRYYMECRMIVR